MHKEKLVSPYTGSMLPKSVVDNQKRQMAGATVEQTNEVAPYMPSKPKKKWWQL